MWSENTEWGSLESVFEIPKFTSVFANRSIIWLRLWEVDRKRVIELDLKITLNAEAPGDHITIQGSPPITLSIEGGTPGDPATVAALIRGIPIVIQARPGIVRRLERDHFLD